MRKRPDYFMTTFVKVTGIPPALLFFKPKVCYAEGATRKHRKPFIMMSNHMALLDFVLYLLLFPFNILRFPVAEVLYTRNPMLSYLLNHLGCIHVDRNAYDFSFVGDCLDILDKNGTVGIFPQGRLPVDGKQFPFHPSIVFLALRTDAPIIPVYTDGNYGIFKRTHVMIGKEIYLRELCKEENPSKEELERLTKYLEDVTWDLKAKLEERLAKK